jgi:hypothetical protein
MPVTAEIRLALADRALYKYLCRVSVRSGFRLQDCTNNTNGSKANAIHPVLVAMGGLLPKLTCLVLGQ